MPEFVGSLTDDIALLSDDAPAAEISSPTPATEQIPEAAPSETGTETTATELEQPGEQISEPTGGDEWQAEFLRAHPEYKSKFEALSKQLSENEKFSGSVKGAREFRAQLQAMGGLEKIKELRTRTEQLDSVDKIYYGGNIEEKRQFLSNLQQKNPQAFFTAMANSLSLLSQANPEEYRYLIAPLVTEQLKQDNVWNWLEHIHNELRDKPELAEVSRRLNEFAAVFRKHGLGPARQSEAPEIAARRSEFHAEIGRAAGESLDGDIRAAINHFAPHVSSDPQLQAAIVDQVHAELQNAARGDKHLRHVLANLSYAGVSRSVGNRIANLLASKLRLYIPAAVQKLAREFPHRPHQQRPMARRRRHAKRD